MSSMVSARVPDETRYYVDEQLKKLGATPSQLINAAYEYVQATGRLPQAPARPHDAGRVWTPQLAEQLNRRLEATTQPVPEQFFADTSYDRILEEELYADYEALA